MPELPEVQTVVTTLRPRLVGRRITGLRLTRLEILQPPGTDLPACLVGRAVTAVERRGKRIVFTLDDAAGFYVHLGMTGQLTVAANPADPQPVHTHLLIDLDSGQQLRFRDPRRFGGIWWTGTSGGDDDSMGPEPLTLKPAELARRLGRTSRAVKTALLDQRLVAGIGNIYADEALFAAGIDPTTPGNALGRAQVGRLSRAIKTTLSRAIRHRGSSLRDYVDGDGAAGGFQLLHAVYGREGGRCRRCRTPIERIVLGGRSTHFCPKCQA